MSGPSPEDLAQLFAAGMPFPAPPPSPGSMRRKLLIAILIAGVGVGASFMSCVGQSFSLRQARALEGIEQQLTQIRASCVAAPLPDGTTVIRGTLP
jgi:hypothetical protein